MKIAVKKLALLTGMIIIDFGSIHKSKYENKPI